MKTEKNQVWNYNSDIELENCAPGVNRKILAYTDEVMCVENHFDKGAIGALHHPRHLRRVMCPVTYPAMMQVSTSARSCFVHPTGSGILPVFLSLPDINNSAGTTLKG